MSGAASPQQRRFKGRCHVTTMFVGGTDIPDSTALEYNANGVADVSNGGSMALPEMADEAFRLISGYCGNFSTRTGWAEVAPKYFVTPLEYCRSYGCRGSL